MQENNAASIAEANKKCAKAVTVDTSKLVYADGTPVNLSSTKAVKQWLRAKYHDTQAVISDDGQVVEFTTKGFGDDQKRKLDKTAQRLAYADLDRIVENSIYYSSKSGDTRHEHVSRQKTYYGLINLNGRYYAVQIKIDLHKSKRAGFFKALEVTEIKSPSLLHGGGLKKDLRSHQEEGDVLSVPVLEIKLAFDPH